MNSEFAIVLVAGVAGLALALTGCGAPSRASEVTMPAWEKEAPLEADTVTPASVEAAEIAGDQARVLVPFFGTMVTRRLIAP